MMYIVKVMKQMSPMQGGGHGYGGGGSGGGGWSGGGGSGGGGWSGGSNSGGGGWSGGSSSGGGVGGFMQKMMQMLLSMSVVAGRKQYEKTIV
ncbi:hypothetical protein MTO96_010421 [Rhipicephalus appendiculatus]